MLKTLRKPESRFSGLLIWFVIYAFLLNSLSSSFFAYVPPVPINSNVSLVETLMGFLVPEAQAATDTDTVRAIAGPTEGNGASAGSSSGGGMSYPSAVNDTASINVGGGGGSVNSVMGAYGYTYPIQVPEGRGGLTPSLALVYSSMGGTSWFGKGWDMALGSVQRKTKGRAPDYTDADTFVITLKGVAIELVREDDEYRLKDEGLFLRILKEGGQWQATDKSGTTYYFGSRTNSRLDGWGGTFRWRLDRIEDANGNYLTIDYFKDSANGGALYPERIEYAGHTSYYDPTYSVHFYKEPRPDPMISYLTGNKVTTAYRIQTIEVRDDEGETIRAYRLQYNSINRDSPLETSYLEKVQMFGTDAVLEPVGHSQLPHDLIVTGGSSLPYTTFFYRGIHKSTINDMQLVEHDDTEKWYDQNIWQLDFNGDGDLDLFCISRDHNWFSKTSSWKLYKGQGGQFTEVASGDQLHGIDLYKQTIVHPADYNGDGKTDIAISSNPYGGSTFEDGHDNPNIYIFYSNGEGFDSPKAVNLSSIFIRKTNKSISPGDFNGDGRTDLMIQFRTDPQDSCIDPYDGEWMSNCIRLPEGILMYLATDSGFELTQRMDWISQNSNFESHSLPPLVMGDFNGDGRTDMIVRKVSFIHYSRNYPSGLYLSNGRSMVLTSTDDFGLDDYGTSGQRIALGDFNGDGRTDLLTNGGQRSGYTVRLSKNNTFVKSHHGDFPGRGEIIRTGDFNGDGLSDMLVTAVRSSVSNLDGFQIYICAANRFFAGSNVRGDDPDWRDHFFIGDYNKDGRSEFFATHKDGASNSWRGMKMYQASTEIDLRTDNGHSYAPLPLLLTDITHSLGTITLIKYTPSTTWQEEGDTMPMALPTVYKTTVYERYAGDSTSTYYTYEAPHYDIKAKEFRGFRKAIVEDETTLTRVENTYHQDPRLQGRIGKSTTYSNNNVPIAETHNEWDFYVYESSGVERTFAYVRQNKTIRYDDNGKALTTVTSDYQYDGGIGKVSYGNLIYEEKREKNHITGDDTTIATRTEYNNDPQRWILGKPRHIRIDTTDPGPPDPGNEAAAALRETRMTYDPAKPWQLQSSSKVLWQEEGGVMVEKEITTNFRYDIFGNTTWTSDPRNPNWVTTISNGESDGLFPNLTTDALGHKIHRVFDPKFGKVIKETVNYQNNDEQTTTFSYDAFGRQVEIRYPDNSVKRYGYQIVKGNHRVMVSSTLEPDTTTYYDNKGRVYQTILHDGTRNVFTQILYDEVGRVWKTSLPYFNYDPQKFTERIYDDSRGRIIKIINPDGTYRTIDYDGLDEIHTDEKGYQKRITKDSMGRLTKVEEASGGVTEYVYDLFGNLIWIEDPLGNQTDIYYDELGRKISMDDPYMGHWEYRYDEAGNLIWQQDAQGRVVEITYDAINRLEAKLYRDTNRYTEYRYGQSRHGYYYNAGALTTITTTQPARDLNVITYDYDRMGRVVHETRRIDGVTYHISKDYDEAGRVRNLYYPNNSLRIEYDYHPMGHLRSVDMVAGATRTTLAAYSDFTALGQMQNAVFGNGAVSDYDYDPNHHRLKNLQTRDSNNRLIQNLVYTFDDVGNVDTITDDANKVDYDFNYDSLHRLVTATADSPGDPDRAYHQTYTYDLAGNMTAKTGLGGFRVTAWQDAQKHIRPASVLYDQETVGVGERHVQYDQSNKPTTITYKGDTSYLYYDGTGSRVRKDNGGQSDIYVGGLYEIRDGQVHLNIFAGGTRLATIRSGQAFYNHGDHLGSTSLVTDAGGQVVEEIGYLPFGATLFRNTYAAGVWTSSYRFTGQEYDAEYELYNYNARLYDPTLGRFITADTIVPDWSDPQSLNRYSYCRNNPLKYVDPSGHFAWAAFGLAILYGAMIGAAVGGLRAAMNGGDVWEGLRGGAVSGAISGAMFYCAGSVISSFNVSDPCVGIVHSTMSNASQAGVHVVTGAASGAVNAAITGGDVGQSALIGGLSAGFSKYLGGGMPTRMGVGAAAGGMGSVMNGGDFAEGAIQGAMTSAIATICNHILHRIEMTDRRTKVYYYKISDEVDEVIDPWTEEGEMLYFMKGFGECIYGEQPSGKDATLGIRCYVEGKASVWNAKLFPQMQVLKSEYIEPASDIFEMVKPFIKEGSNQARDHVIRRTRRSR